jgi:hypothetical protein
VNYFDPDSDPDFVEASPDIILIAQVEILCPAAVLEPLLQGGTLNLAETCLP